MAREAVQDVGDGEADFVGLVASKGRTIELHAAEGIAA